MLNKLFFIILINLTVNLFSQADTINIYYDIGIFKLNKTNLQQIKNKLDTLDDKISYQVEISFKLRLFRV